MWLWLAAKVKDWSAHWWWSGAGCRPTGRRRGRGGNCSHSAAHAAGSHFTGFPIAAAASAVHPRLCHSPAPISRQCQLISYFEKDVNRVDDIGRETRQSPVLLLVHTTFSTAWLAVCGLHHRVSIHGSKEIVHLLLDVTEGSHGDIH